jgi:hypothetical protein
MPIQVRKQSHRSLVEGGWDLDGAAVGTSAARQGDFVKALVAK